MSNMDEPRPLLDQDDVSPKLKTALSSAREDVADEREMKRLGLVLGPLFALPPGSELPAELAQLGTQASATGQSGMMPAVAGKSSALGVSKAATPWFGAKIAAGVGVLTIGAAATWYGVKSDEPAPSSRAPEVPETVASQLEREKAETQVAKPEAVETAPAEAEPTEPAKVKSPQKPVAKALSDKALSDKAPSKAGDSDKLTELQLLQRARGMIQTQPKAALQLLARHQREFPKSALSQEREVMKIRALDQLGRTTEAERKSKQFEKRFPDSAHRRSLDAR